MDIPEYNRIRNLLYYGIRLYRRFALAYNLDDISPIITIDDFMNNAGSAKFVSYFYPFINRIRRSIDVSREFISKTEVGEVFYAIRNYLLNYYNYMDFGKASKEMLGIHIHDLSADYQIIHKTLFGYEDEGYYKIFGQFLSPTISLLGNSSQYSNHNAYSFILSNHALDNQGIIYQKSYVPENGKYYGDYFFVVKTAVPNTFYAKCDVITPNGTVINNVFFKFDKLTQNVVGLANHYSIGQELINITPKPNLKPTNMGTPQSSIPNGSKIIKILELHLPNTYNYTVGDIMVISGRASNFYTGLELYSPDPLYQLPIIE